MREVVTGTGTDCIVVAAPGAGEPLSYAGMHTAVGEAVGNASCMQQAAEVWFDDWRRRFSHD